MSCGIIESRHFCYPSGECLLRSCSSESFNSSQMTSLMGQMSPDFYGHLHDGSMTLEDIRSQYNSCYSCGVSWSDEHVSLDCSECGGYSLSRPCPQCEGECKSEWQRDVSMSHDLGKAQWEGECSLLKQERPKNIPYLAEDVLIQGIEELLTHKSS